MIGDVVDSIENIIPRKRIKGGYANDIRSTFLINIPNYILIFNVKRDEIDKQTDIRRTITNNRLAKD